MVLLLILQYRPYFKDLMFLGSQKNFLYIHQEFFLLAEVKVQYFPPFLQSLKSLFRFQTLHNYSWLGFLECCPILVKLQSQPKAQRYHMIFFYLLFCGFLCSSFLLSKFHPPQQLCSYALGDWFHSTSLNIT